MTQTVENQKSGFDCSPAMINRRALKLRCPRCGIGKMFRGFFAMQDQCSNCGLSFLREPGFYLGSIYMNYGLTALVSTVTYVVGRFYFQLPSSMLMTGLVLFCLVCPVLFFRHARSLWLALDCRLDAETLREGLSGDAHDNAQPELRNEAAL